MHKYTNESRYTFRIRNELKIDLPIIICTLCIYRTLHPKSLPCHPNWSRTTQKHACCCYKRAVCTLPQGEKRTRCKEKDQRKGFFFCWWGCVPQLLFKVPYLNTSRPHICRLSFFLSWIINILSVLAETTIIISLMNVNNVKMWHQLSPHRICVEKGYTVKGGK